MDVTANLATAEQLTAYVQAAGLDSHLNQDQWCWALAQIIGTPCPAYDVGNPPTVKTDAQTFLDGLRGYQLSVNAGTQQPGGATLNGTAGGSVSPATPVLGAGLLGPTNCKFCQWLATPTGLMFLAGVGIGVYFAFFYKKG